MDTLTELYKHLTSNGNPLLAGVVSLYGLGILTWFLRDVPTRIINWIWGQVTTSVTIHNSDEVYYRIIRWIGDHKMHRFMRDYSLGSDGFWGGERLMSLGYGRNFIWYKRLIIVNRSKQESNGITRVKETMVLTALGRNRQIFRDILEEIDRLEKNDTTHLTVFRFNDNSWFPMLKIAKRPLDTIVVPDEIKTNLCGHIERFMADKDWYIQNGIPHRTGVLLYGPPGTGKTSTVTALCSHFNRDCYVLDLSTVSDEKLIHAFAHLPENGFVLIEDIDATLSRPKNRMTDQEEEQKEALRVSLAGVLNAIDGMCGASSRVIFATTNHLERLDPALVREGRFNLKLELGYMTDATLRHYMTRLYRETPPDLNQWHVKPEVAPCKVQQLVFDNRENPHAVLEQVAYKMQVVRV